MAFQVGQTPESLTEFTQKASNVKGHVTVQSKADNHLTAHVEPYTVTFADLDERSRTSTSSRTHPVPISFAEFGTSPVNWTIQEKFVLLEIDASRRHKAATSTAMARWRLMPGEVSGEHQKARERSEVPELVRAPGRSNWEDSLSRGRGPGWEEPCTVRKAYMQTRIHLPSGVYG